ncbi:MAG: hypothetical protein ITG00_03490, partial [Flavobacterium sp.]|nr:hypothetical protein [Flavobacterium sp.]
MQTPISNQDFQKKPINLKYQIVHYLSKWYWFALGIIVCLLLASIYLRYAIPMYSASALILVKDDKKGGMVSDLVSLTEMDMMGKVKSTADNEIQIIKSRTIIEHAVKELELNIRYFTEGNIKTLELYRSTPIKLVLDNPSLLKKNLRLTVQSSGGDSYTLYNADEELIGTYKFGQQVKHPSSNFTILNTANSGSSLKVTVTAIPTLRMAQSYKGRISVGLVDEKTSVVSLTVTDAVPKRAEEFLNALIHNYNLDAVTDKGMIFKNTSKFIDERIALIEDELGAVEQSGENYKKSNQVTDIVSEAGMYLR